MSVPDIRTRTGPRVTNMRTTLAGFSYWCFGAARMLAPYVLTLGLVLLTPPNANAANSNETKAEDFVQSSIDEGYAILNDSTLSVDERENRLRALLLMVIDLKRISAFTLGAYARSAPPAAIHSFADAFANFVTVIYERNLDVSGQTIRVTGSKVLAADDVIVTADVIRLTANRPPLKIAFRVRKTTTGNNAIVDLQAEGVWLALTQRSEFTAYLQQHGGDILELSGELESRAERIRAGTPGRSSSDNEAVHGVLRSTMLLGESLAAACAA